MKAALYRRLIVVPLIVLSAQAFAPAAGANHAWENFHWGRTANPFQLQLGNNLSSAWSPVLGAAASDWSKSTVLDAFAVAGGTTARRCSATAGRVEVCNATYGRTQWLGIASVWSVGGHITQGTVKMNDTYFNTAKYNSPEWRSSVMCQEIGHTLGLSHNDEDFSTTTGTCMDYANNPTANQHPDAHDYEQLLTIYAHTDTVNTATPLPSSPSTGASVLRQDEWGRAVRFSSDGRPIVFEHDLGGGQRVVTFVRWAV